MKEKNRTVKGRKIIKYLFPVLLGYYILLYFRLNWIWEILEKIFNVTFEAEIRAWGSSLFRLVFSLYLAVWVKWNMKREVFCEKRKIGLKRKILVLFLLFTLDAVIPEIIWAIQGMRGRTTGAIDFGAPVGMHMIYITYFLACSLTEELFFRYITCNCLRKLRINKVIIILFQAIIFALHHNYGFLDSLFVFFSGIIFGMVLYLTKTPFCGWLLHSAYNLKVLYGGELANLFYVAAFFLSVIYLIFSQKNTKKSR